MKKFALALIASAAAVFGFGMVANAQTYTPVLQPPTPPTTLGGPFTVTYNNCVVGETITFTLLLPGGTTAIQTINGPCVAPALTSGSVVGLLLPQQAANGRATATFPSSPTTPGTYTIRAQGTTSAVVTTQLVVPGSTSTTVAPTATTPGGGLPATGSDASTPFTMIAIGLLVVGVGLFAVAQVRRRQAPNPA
jgi:LPXTG-motif cell wall-anchored protein